MGLTAMTSPLSTALLLLAAVVAPSRAASMAAWMTGYGPQIIIQNATTGAVRHSPCNAYGTPTYSYTDSGYELPLIIKPKNGTALAGTGWWDNVKTIASVYYVEERGRLANALFECNMDTGRFKRKANSYISPEENTVHNNTALAAILLGETGGYRVYYHDADMTVNEIGYTSADGWNYKGALSRDPQGWPALGAWFRDKQNITVVSARDADNLMFMRLNSDTTWRSSTSPQTLEGDIITEETNATSYAYNTTVSTNYTLPAWNGKPGSLGLSIDEDHSRSVWYIGIDGGLYSVRSRSFVWSLEDTQSTAFWPMADSPNAEFALASQSVPTIVRLYYFVKGQLTEVKYEDGAWSQWAALGPPKAAVSQSPTSPISPTGTATSTAIPASADTGLSPGAKAGVAVGVVLAVIALAALGAAFYLMRRRRGAIPIEPESPGFEKQEEVSPYGTPGPQPDSAGYDQYMWEKNGMSPQQPPAYPAQLHADTTPTELAVPRPMYELPEETYRHELVGDANVERHQAP